MKAKITYIGGDVKSIIENSRYSFVDFCKNLFKARIYFSISTTEKGISICINTDNICVVEEVKE